MQSFQILITGGAGFIGTHLCQSLVKSGHRIRVLDLKIPPTPVPGVEYIQGDVRDLKTLKSSMAIGNSFVDVVYHFAAIVSVPICQKKLVESYETNVLGTARVIEAIRKSSRTVRLIFASSSAVYGSLGDSREPLLEDSDTLPLGYYAAQKLASEHLIQIAHATEGLPAIIFRFFNVYGIGQDPTSPYSGVITVFSHRIREKLPISLHGGGTQTRDFISVHDIISACNNTLTLPEIQCDARPINLATGQAISIRELAKLMVKISGYEIPLIDKPARKGDVYHSLASVTRARKVFRNQHGWQPKMSLETGLRELLTSSTT
ncbi:MAG: NAD-dependent epimerase/dehydratase family protein [Candidatus Poribacteria bacterium]